MKKPHKFIISSFLLVRSPDMAEVDPLLRASQASNPGVSHTAILLICSSGYRFEVVGRTQAPVILGLRFPIILVSVGLGTSFSSRDHCGFLPCGPYRQIITWCLLSSR